MPPIPISGPPRPYVRTPYSQDTRQLGNIYARQGEILAEQARMHGVSTNQFISGLALAFTQLQRNAAAKREQDADFAFRKQEREAATQLKREERDERAAERQTAGDERAAIYAAENAAPGPIDRMTAQVIRKFPGTAARLRMQETLPARVTPGAMGEIAPPESFDTLEPTPAQMRQSQLDGAARERDAQMAQDRDADNARQVARDAQVARHETAMERAANARPAAQEPLEAVIGPDGNPVLVPRSQALGKRPATTREQPTEDERKTAGFYKQMNDAIAIMDSVESKLTPQDLYQIQSLPQEDLIGLANRGQMSEAAKRYIRAFEQFTEARLRPVSGAAISDTEFARDRRTYAKQYGETTQLNKDRRAARGGALDALKTRGGRALPKEDGPPKDNDPLGIRK